MKYTKQYGMNKILKPKFKKLYRKYVIKKKF